MAITGPFLSWRVIFQGLPFATEMALSLLPLGRWVNHVLLGSFTPSGLLRLGKSASRSLSVTSVCLNYFQVLQHLDCYLYALMQFFRVFCSSHCIVNSAVRCVDFDLILRLISTVLRLRTIIRRLFFSLGTFHVCCRYDGPRKMRVVLANMHGNNNEVEAETSLLHRMLRGSLDPVEEPCLVNRNPRWNAKVRYSAVLRMYSPSFLRTSIPAKSLQKSRTPSGTTLLVCSFVWAFPKDQAFVLTHDLGCLSKRGVLFACYAGRWGCNMPVDQDFGIRSFRQNSRSAIF